MKREIVVILTFIVLSLGISLIYTLINPKTDFKKSPESTLRFDKENYIIKKEQDNMIEYELNDLAFLDLYINSFNILYKENTLKINDVLIASGISLFKRCAFYSDSRLVLFIKYLDKSYGAYVIYNILNNTFEIIDSIDDMYIIIDDNIYFENIGFTMNVSQVIKNRFIKDNNLICNIKDNRVIQKYIEVYYDPNSLKFDRLESISSLDLMGYKKSNGYC